MDFISFTTAVMPLIIAVASTINNAIKAFNTLLQIIELYMKRKPTGEAQTLTCQHKSPGKQAKRRRQRRE